MLVRRAIAIGLIASPALAEKAGMPQMDASWFANQLLWLAISFLLLYAIVVRVIKPGVGGVLEKRAQAIREAIAEAERARQAATHTRGDFEAAGNSARARANELLATAQADTARDAAEAGTRLAHDLARNVQKAEARIAEALDIASAQVDQAVASLTEAMVARLAGSH